MTKRRSDHEIADEIVALLDSDEDKARHPGAEAKSLLQQAIDAGGGGLRMQYLKQAQREIAKLDPRRHGTLINQLQSQILALQGRHGDTQVAHVTPGEVVIPRQLQTPQVMAELRAAAEQAGIDPSRLTVGSGENSINPRTGAPEFAGENLAPPEDAIETIEVTGRRPFSPNDIQNAARLIYAEAGNQPYEVKQKVMQTMLSRVGTVNNRDKTLNDVMFAKRPGGEIYEHEGVSHPRFTETIPDKGPDRNAWDQSLEIARNSINDAIQNGVEYGNRFFQNVPGAKPAALEFWDMKPGYKDDISKLPYPKIKK